ncbi:hypothetical protein PINS_up014124 [Pythium insidiosum]|nr:hypothetical protein PINS_up014124 [Pythium insidiosum]
METADPLVTYAGWAFKEGSLVKNWKKRFIVVKRRELAYYKTTDHTSSRAQMMGSMRIARVERATNITNGLLLVGVDGRELKIFMDTPAESDKCYNAIAHWCHPRPEPAKSAARKPTDRRNTGHDGKSRSDPASTTQSNAHVPARSKPNQHIGWLDKQGQQFKTWKRRYFVLNDDVLTYAADMQSEPLARHRVLGARRDRTRPFTLEISLENGRELRVSAESEMDIEDWHKAIRNAIQLSPTRSAPQASAPSGATNQPSDSNNDEEAWQLFGRPMEEEAAPPLSFGRSISLQHEGDNLSFIEHEPQPLPKPYSPRAPSEDTIRRMRIEQHLLDSDDEEETVHPIGAGGHSSSSKAGACCCCVM